MSIALDRVVPLAEACQQRRTQPEQIVEEVLQRLRASPHEAVWLHLASEDELRRAAERVRQELDSGALLPLAGVPFAVKDNLDVAGWPTTAACPDYAYTPKANATVVRQLIEAGAILVGKTNMDQFATGLVGTRSPYGVCRCVYDERYLSGGSSSGSAVAVAGGLVSFALGTDTAGSGRVPAAFNGLVGLKPTRGRLSTAGLVPACRSLDCVSVFAHTPEDAQAVMLAAEGPEPDPEDPYARLLPAQLPAFDPESFTFGVPAPSELRFFGDEQAERLYQRALERLEEVGGQRIDIDYRPFAQVAELLYAGPWVAERYAAIGSFLQAKPQSVHPVVRTIIGSAARLSAADAFLGYERLEGLRSAAEAAWEGVDVLALPTTGTIYRVDEALAEPFALNTNLGYYTNFVNLLDLCALAVPAGLRAQSGLPFGITLIGRAFEDASVIEVGQRYEALLQPTPTPAQPRRADQRGPQIELAVVGAHLSGQPLNYQLTSRGARLVKTCRTAPYYRLYALADTQPPKPALVHDQEGQPGAAQMDTAGIEVELWSMSLEAFGQFAAEVPPPLAIGSLTLEDGSLVKGFVCEPRAIAGAREITRCGSWRAYLQEQRNPPG